VNTENFPINYRSQCQIIEDFSAVAPRIGVAVLLLAFIEEPIHLCNLSTLMVSTKKSNFVRISGLESRSNENVSKL